MPCLRKKRTEQEKANSLQSAFSQLGWQSEETAPAQTAPPQLGSVIPYAPDVFGHDEETEDPGVDIAVTSHDPQTPVGPPCNSVRRKGGRSTDSTASAPKRTRGLVTGRKVEKMCKTMRGPIPVKFDEFTKGVSGKELSSLTTYQIGKIVRATVRMTAPNWESLEEAEKFKVVCELSVHFNLEQRREMLDAIDKTTSDVYKRWKHALHKFYEEHGMSIVPEEFEHRKDE